MKNVQSNRGYELPVGEARRISHSASYLLSPNSSNHYSIALDCLKLSKSMSSRRLKYLTCLQKIYTFWKWIRSLYSEILTLGPGSYRVDAVVQYKSKTEEWFLSSRTVKPWHWRKFHGESFRWDDVHKTLIGFAANFHRNCAQIPRNDASASRNRLSHEVLRTRAAVCGSFSSQDPRRSLYFASWWSGRFHYSPSHWYWCCLNSRDDVMF
jgi:hypothetical protein